MSVLKFFGEEPMFRLEKEKTRACGLKHGDNRRLSNAEHY